MLRVGRQFLIPIVSNVRINNLPEGEGALVCFKKDNECYYKMVISDNEFHTFAYSPKITGTMTITVTARNFIPYEKSFKIATDLVGDFSIAEIVNLMGKPRLVHEHHLILA